MRASAAAPDCSLSAKTKLLFKAVGEQLQDKQWLQHRLTVTQPAADLDRFYRPPSPQEERDFRLLNVRALFEQVEQEAEAADRLERRERAEQQRTRRQRTLSIWSLEELEQEQEVEVSAFFEAERLFSCFASSVPRRAGRGDDRRRRGRGQTGRAAQTQRAPAPAAAGAAAGALLRRAQLGGRVPVQAAQPAPAFPNL